MDEILKKMREVSEECARIEAELPEVEAERTKRRVKGASAWNNAIVAAGPGMAALCKVTSIASSLRRHTAYLICRLATSIGLTIGARILLCSDLFVAKKRRVQRATLWARYPVSQCLASRFSSTGWRDMTNICN